MKQVVEDKKKKAHPLGSMKTSPKAVAVAPKKTTALVAGKKASTDLSAWGDAPKLSSKDVIIPRILCMQPSSKVVTNGEAKFGEFKDSFGNTLGDVNHPVEFIPVHHEHCFVVMKLTDGQFSFSKIVPITAENDDHEFMCENEEGQAEKWYRTLNFYVLRPSEIESGEAMPYLLSLRSSSARAGREIYTQMFMLNRKEGIVPPGRVIALHGAKQKNDKGTFIVMSTKVVRDSSEEEVACALQWFKTIQSGKTKIDTTGIDSEESVSHEDGPVDSEEY